MPYCEGCSDFRSVSNDHPVKSQQQKNNQDTFFFIGTIKFNGNALKVRNLPFPRRFQSKSFCKFN